MNNNHKISTNISNNNDVKNKKKLMRITYNNILKNLTTEYKEKSSSNCNIFLISFIKEKHPNNLVLSFYNMDNEINIKDTNRFLAQNNSLVLPKINKITNQLECYLVPKLSLDYLELLDKFGILEPNPDTCQLIDPSKISLIITPGLAFDNNTNNNPIYRLGRGKGYYDQLLSKTSPHCQKIGIGFLSQISNDPIPIEDHDQPLDNVHLF